MGQAVVSSALREPTVLASATLIEAGVPADDLRAFRRCLGQYPTGVAVMTASNEGRLVGMSANSFAALSLEPPLVLWSIRKASISLHDFSQATHFAVNVLTSQQAPVAMHFATPSNEKFKDVKMSSGLGGAPLLEGCLAYFECRLQECLDQGDHLLMVGLVERYARLEGEPLVFSQGRYAVTQEHPALVSGDRAEAVGQTSELPFDLEVASLMRLANFAVHRLSLRFNESFKGQATSEIPRRLMGWLRQQPYTCDELVALTFLGQGIILDELKQLQEIGDAVCDPDARFSLTKQGREKADGIALQVAEVESGILRHTKAAEVQEIRKSLARLACLADAKG